MPVSRMSRAATKTKKRTSYKASAVASAKSRKASKAKPQVKRRAADARLADAERYSLALESINENLYDWDIENDTVYYAPGLYKILGISPEQMRSPKDWT